MPPRKPAPPPPPVRSTLHLRLPDDQHDEVTAEANAEARSLSSMARILMQEGLAARQAKRARRRA